MVTRFLVLLFPLCLGLFAAAEQGWQTKEIAQWTPEDAQQILKDSPGVKTVTPTVTQPSNQPAGNSGGRRGGYGGIPVSSAAWLAAIPKNLQIS